MKNKKTLKIILIWLPSVIISLFYIPNAISKIFLLNTDDKIVSSSFILILTGVYLLLSTALFLYNKTIIIGTTFLAFYMTCIVFIHILKDKPYEVTILIIMATIFAAYIRMPQLFIQKNDLNN